MTHIRSLRRGLQLARGAEHGMSRRQALGAVGAALCSVALPHGVLAQDTQPEGEADTGGGKPSVPFSFDSLSEQMKLAALQDAPQRETIEGFLDELDYDDYQRIRFDSRHAQWADTEGSLFRLHAFHPGWLFKEPVSIHEVVDGQATPMTFTTDDFDYSSLEREVPSSQAMPGVAGFRLHNQLNKANHYDELVSFLGASYFRALGRDNVYGLSARGLAINTGTSDGEEFPRFTDFWIDRPEPGSDTIIIHAALHSASVTGAYRFVIHPGVTTTMDVTARLFMRNDVQQLGISPLTSMFLFDGADRGDFYDFRPVVHDSSALVMNVGETTFYRPLKNPPRLASSYLGAERPRSFGLVQREREFDQYLDAQAHYERRPSLMVEPLGDWGKGMVRLLEIPSDLEANDNIVAYWVPDAPARAGDSLQFAYRLHWGMSPPGDRSVELARVLRTLSGEGGVAGVEKDTDERKFVIDFEGGLLRELSADAKVDPAITVSNASVTTTALAKVSGTDIWRLVIDVQAEPGSTVELKAALAGYDRTLTETWLYQWVKE
ncbi:glucans biosynthesis protein G [Salipiger pallidus]|uniref:Glucans biosynthesis protein G n=1 Tax=Salipiger pallidus TaxID=1775170 RepID=A0A8J2ZMU9_9RHOB|nr:glucan biosynthesis protein G [Salipiger pallidus]GGG81903.1 glucans biosynthesis protein G [Salipiger pallidus]